MTLFHHYHLPKNARIIQHFQSTQIFGLCHPVSKAQQEMREYKWEPENEACGRHMMRVLQGTGTGQVGSKGEAEIDRWRREKALEMEVEGDSSPAPSSSSGEYWWEEKWKEIFLDRCLSILGKTLVLFCIINLEKNLSNSISWFGDALTHGGGIPETQLYSIYLLNFLMFKSGVVMSSSSSRCVQWWMGPGSR